MLKANERKVTMTWEKLAEILRRADVLLRKEEVISNITLTKPKGLIFNLERRIEKETSHVSE